MLIRTGYEMIFELSQPVAMQLLLQIHPSRQSDVLEEKRTLESNGSPITAQSYCDGFGNKCERILAPTGRLRLWADALIKDLGEPDATCTEATQHPVEELPPQVMQFLHSSRYCEVDKLSPIAWELFESTPPGWANGGSEPAWYRS